MPDRTLKFEIAVGTDGMVQGLKIATKAVDDTTQSMKFGMGKGGEAVNSLTKSLERYKAEQVSQARTGRFFASQLAEIAPISETAKSALQGLIGIGLGGFGLGMAFEGAVFVLGQLKNHLEENEK